jgi:uncharacterized membrane protein YbhN (UPF0104 family)
MEADDSKSRAASLSSGQRASVSVEPQGKTPRSGVWIMLVKLAISASAIAFVAYRLNLSAAIDRTAHQNLDGLGAAAAVMAVQLALGALRWHVIRLRIGIRSSFFDTFRIYYIGSFFASYVWSGISGDIVRVWLSWRYGASRGAALYSTILDRVALIAGIAVLIILTSPWFFVRFGFSAEGWLPFLAAVTLLVGIVGLAQFDRLPITWRQWLPLRMLGSLGGAAREVFLRPGAVLPAIGTAMIGQAALGLATYILARSLEINVMLTDCIVIMQIVALLTAVPISIGGWGVREMSMVGLFGLVDIPASSALVLSVQLGLIGLALNLPGGIFWLIARPQAQSAGDFSLSALYGRSAPP